MARANIVVAGSANTDMFILMDALPSAGETHIGGEFQTKPGGKGANQAVAAARAGSAVCLIANLGDDLFGRNTVETLVKERVSIDFVSLDRHAPTGVAMIMVDSAGQNMIAVAPGANSMLTPKHIEKAQPRIKDADFLLLQMEIPLDTVSYAIELAHDERTPVVLNAAPAPRSALPSDLIAKVDTLIVNEFEAAVLSGTRVDSPADGERAAQTLRNMGAKRVVITLGSRGALALGDKLFSVGAKSVEAVDTVGAGDAFCGALVTALGEGFDFADAVSFANAAAALACTRVGAQASLPARTDIESFWKQ